MMFMMPGRWWIASAAAVGLGLAAIPLVTRSGVRTETSVHADAPATPDGEKLKAATEAGVCTAKPKAAPLDFTVKDMHGKDVRLADYKGKVVMLNFWATWCGPCKVEIPMFTDLQQKYQSQGLAFLGISVDDAPEQLREFAQEYKMNYPVLVGNGRDDVQTAFGPMFGIPITLLIARDGTICTRYLGPRPRERFERDIKALL